MGASVCNRRSRRGWAAPAALGRATQQADDQDGRGVAGLLQSSQPLSRGLYWSVPRKKRLPYLFKICIRLFQIQKEVQKLCTRFYSAKNTKLIYLGAGTSKRLLNFLIYC